MATTDEIENIEVEEKLVVNPVSNSIQKSVLVEDEEAISEQVDISPLVDEIVFDSADPLTEKENPFVEEPLIEREDPLVSPEEPLVSIEDSSDVDPFNFTISESDNDSESEFLVESREQRLEAIRLQAEDAAATIAANPSAYEREESPVDTSDDDDPLLLRVFKNAAEIPEQVYGGTALALNNTANAIDELGEVLYDNIPIEIQRALKYSPVAPLAYYLQHAKETNPAQLPVPDADTVTGQVTQSISQFVVGFIPTLRATRLLTGGAKTMNWFGRAAEATAAGAVTDYFVWDPHEERLANMLNELEIAGVSLKNPVFDYLQQDDADGNIESRLKTMVEGGMFGVIAEPAMAVFSTTLMASLRFLRIAKKEAGLASRQDPINNELNVYSNGLEGEASLERINNDSVRYVLRPGKYFDSKDAGMRDDMSSGLDGNPDLDPAILQRALDGDSEALDNPVIKQWLINNDYEGHWYKAIDSVGPEVPGTDVTSPQVSAGFVPTTPFTRTYKAPNSVIGMSDDQIEEAVEASKAGHAADIRRVFDPDTAEKVIKLDQRNSDSALRELELMDMTEDQSFVIYGNRDIEGDSLTYEDLDQLLRTSRNSIYSPEIKNAEILLDLQRVLLDLKPEQFSLIRDGGGDVSEQGLFIQMVKAMDELMQRGLSKDQIDRGVIGAARKRGMEDNDIESMFGDFLGEWTKPQPRTVRESAPMIEPPVREEPLGASDGTDFVGPPAARSHIRVYEPTGKLVVAPPEDIFTTYMKLGDPKEGIISKQAIEDYRSGKISLDEFLGEVNFARLSEDGGVQEIVKTFNEFMLDTPQFSKAFDDGRNFIEPIDINKLIEIDRINGTRLAETLEDGDKLFEIYEGKKSVGALVVKIPNANGVAEASWRGVNDIGDRAMHILLRQIKRQIPELTGIQGKSLGAKLVREPAEDVQPRGWEIPEEGMDVLEGPISDAKLNEIANNLNLTVEEVMNWQATHKNVNRGFLTATNMLYESASIQVKKIADEITLLDSQNIKPDAQIVYEMNMLSNLMIGIGASSRRQASEAGRTLRQQRLDINGPRNKLKISAEFLNDKLSGKIDDFQALSGTIQEVKERIDQSIISNGSMDQAVRLARAISDGEGLEDFKKVLRGGTFKRFTDMIVEMWYFGWLSSIPLHAGNIFGNSINVLYQIPERALAAQVGKARRAMGRGSAEDAVVDMEVYGMMAGYATFIKEAMSKAYQTLKTGETTHQKLDPRRGGAWTAEAWNLENSDNAFGKPLGKTLNAIGMIFNFPGRLLSTADEFFGVWATQANMTALGHREATKLGLSGKAYAEKVDFVIKNPTPLQMAESKKFAHALTLTTPLGTTGKKMQSLMSRHPVIAKPIVPFFKTPANIVKFAGVRSPIGWFAKSVRADIAAGGAAGDLALARMALGTGIAFTVANEVWSQRITGAGPSNPNLRQDWLLTHQPFSMLVGDTWVSYDRADPIGIVFGVSASFAEMTGNMSDDDNLTAAAALSLAISKSIVSKTWLNGFSRTLKAFNDGNGNFLERELGKYASNFIPGSGIINTGRMAIDPIWRDVEEWHEVISSRTPGFSDDLPANKNYWGEDITHETVGPRWLSPLFTMKANSPPASDWLWENRVKLQQVQQTQSFPSRFGSASVELTTHEHARLKELSGNEWKDPSTGLGFLETMNSIIEGNHPLSRQWSNSTDGPDGMKELMFKNIQRYFRQGAKAYLLNESEEIQERANVEGRAAFEALTIGPQI